MLTCDYCGTTLPESDFWNDRCMPCTIKALQARIKALKAQLAEARAENEALQARLADALALVPEGQSTLRVILEGKE